MFLNSSVIPELPLGLEEKLLQKSFRVLHAGNKEGGGKEGECGLCPSGALNTANLDVEKWGGAGELGAWLRGTETMVTQL